MVDEFGREEDEHEPSPHRNENALPESDRLEVRDERQRVALVFDGVCDRRTKCGGVKDHVGVGRENPTPARSVERLLQREGFSEPARGRLRAFDDAKPLVSGERTQHRARSVGRAVVDGDDFKVFVVLREDGADALQKDSMFLVARGDENGDARRVATAKARVVRRSESLVARECDERERAAEQPEEEDYPRELNEPEESDE